MGSFWKLFKMPTACALLDKTSRLRLAPLSDKAHLPVFLSSYCENDLDVLWYVRMHVNDYL